LTADQDANELEAQQARLKAEQQAQEREAQQISAQEKTNTKEWIVSVNLAQGKFGIEARAEDDGSISVLKIKRDGLIALWNEAYRDKAVREFDKIVAINGQRAVQDVLSKACRAKASVELLLRRDGSLPVDCDSPKKNVQKDLVHDDFARGLSSGDESISNGWTVTVDTAGGKLGLDVCSQGIIGLSVTRVKKGLIEDWNKANPMKSVRRGDLLISANGHTGETLANALMAEVKANKVLELSFVPGVSGMSSGPESMAE